MTVSRVCLMLTLAAFAAASAAPPAFAISAELAKKCQQMMIKAHPRVLAGTRTGTAQAQRDFFQTCVENNGNVAMPAEPSPAPAPAAAPPSAPSR